MLLPRTIVIINKYVDKKPNRFKKEKRRRVEKSFLLLSVVRSSPKTTISVRRHANMSRLFALEVVLQKLC